MPMNENIAAGPEVFITEPGYDPIWNIGEMGHIAASSDGGPRSDPALFYLAAVKIQWLDANGFDWRFL